jgi:tetratricopeptide (TPR) repeat protein
MKRARIFFIVVLLGCQAALADAPAQEITGRPRAVSQAGAALSVAEAAKWREDLRYMAEAMPKYHQNLFHTMTPAQFEAAVKSLHERIPSLARHQIIVEMARIVALVGDGHTNIYPTRDPKIGFHTLPFKLYLFKDGLFVRAAAREHANLLGGRIVKIGGLSVDEALARVRAIIGRDNEMDVKFFAPFLLTMPEVLHALGLSDDPASARFIIEKGGLQLPLTLHASDPVQMMPADTDTSWLSKEGWVEMRDETKATLPLWLRDPQNKFWFEYLADPRILYVQFNQVGDKETETLADFAGRLAAFVEANPVEKMVLDLRLNRGGNGGLLRPLVLALIKSKVNQQGKLFAIMGRSTFSAAQFFLNELEKYTSAIFVGEPSGSKGNIYGDSRKIMLPNSGLTVRVSVYYWQDWPPWETRLWTAPHLTAELSSEDYRAGRDPAMRAILDYVPRQPLTELLALALAKGGPDLVIKQLREFRAEPLNKYADIEEPLLITGQRLLDQNKPEQALTLFKLDAEANPHSFRAYFAMGEAYFRSGDKEQAARNFEKALELNPKSYDVADRLRQLQQSQRQ